MAKTHGMSVGAALGVAIVARRLVRRLTAYDVRDQVALVTGESRGLAPVDRLLPRPGGIGVTSIAGSDSESPVAPSVLTGASDRAAVRNNEI